MSSIVGKIIGFFLGYMLLGPVGAVFGVLAGAVFDKGLRLNLYTIPRAQSESVRESFFTATFTVMGHLAKSDGRVSEDEIRAARVIMDRLELSQALCHRAIALFNAGKEPRFDLLGTLGQLYRECYKHRDLLRFFIEIQLEAALADGALQDQKQEILLRICDILRFSSREFEELLSQQFASQAFYSWSNKSHSKGYSDTSDYFFRSGSQGSQGSGKEKKYRSRSQSAEENSFEPSLQDAYGVLGVASSANPPDIKKAYRKLMNQHHPDKLASRGLPEEMLKLAKEKTQNIRAAYDKIRLARGFR